MKIDKFGSRVTRRTVGGIVRERLCAFGHARSFALRTAAVKVGVHFRNNGRMDYTRIYATGRLSRKKTTSRGLLRAEI